MIKVGIVTNKGTIEAKEFSSREEADDYLLLMDEKEGLRRYRIEENGIIIETEQGKRWEPV